MSTSGVGGFAVVIDVGVDGCAFVTHVSVRLGRSCEPTVSTHSGEPTRFQTTKCTNRPHAATGHLHQNNHMHQTRRLLFCHDGSTMGVVGHDVSICGFVVHGGSTVCILAMSGSPLLILHCAFDVVVAMVVLQLLCCMVRSPCERRCAWQVGRMCACCR